MKIACYIRREKLKDSPEVLSMLASFSKAGFETYRILSSDDVTDGTSFIVSTGGDGTFLGASLVDYEKDIPLLGVNFGTAYYFWHDAEEPVILNRRLLHEIKTKAEAYVIYADLCALGEAELQKFRITFKKVSRDIVRI